MALILEVLQVKGDDVHRIASTATVYEAIEKMESAGIGSLVIMEGERVAGMLTERDYLRKVALKGRSSKTTAVAEIMSTPVCVTEPTATIESALAVMTEKRCRHLPVVEGGKLTGLVSIGDLVKHLVREQEAHIRHLHDYIQGTYPG